MNIEPNFLEEQLALVRKSCEIASHNAEVEINEMIKKSSRKGGGENEYELKKNRNV